MVKKTCRVCGIATESYQENVICPRYFHGLGTMCKDCLDIWVHAITPSDFAALDKKAISKILPREKQ